MLEDLLPYIRRGSERSIPIWERVVTSYNLRSEIVKTRYLQTGFYYNLGTSLLIQILHGGVTQEVRKCTSDIRRAELLEPALSVYRNMIDPIYQSSTRKNLFTKDNDIPEIILNCSMSTPLMSMPIDKSWNEWRRLVPIHVLYHDSRELNLNLYQMRLQFEKKKPTRVTYSIDLLLFLMRYAKYLDYCDSLGIEGTAEDYLHEHIFMEWYDDLIRIWLFNILSDMVSGSFRLENYVSDEFVAPIVTLKEMQYDAKRLLENAKRRAISAADICSTKWLSGNSITSWLTTISTDITVPELRQYEALALSCTLPYMRFILEMIRYVGRGDASSLSRAIIFKLRRLRDMNIANSYANPYLRDTIKTEIDSALALVKDITLIQ